MEKKTNLFTSKILPSLEGYVVDMKEREGGRTPLTEREKYRYIAQIISELNREFNINQKQARIVQLPQYYDFFVSFQDERKDKEDIERLIKETLSKNKIPLTIRAIEKVTWNYNDDLGKRERTLYSMIVEKFVMGIIKERLERKKDFVRISGTEFIKRDALFNEEYPLSYKLRIEIFDEEIWLYVLIVQKIVNRFERIEELEKDQEVRVLPSFKHAYITYIPSQKGIPQELNENETIRLWEKRGLTRDQILNDYYVSVRFEGSDSIYHYPLHGIVHTVDDKSRSDLFRRHLIKNEEKVNKIREFVEENINSLRFKIGKNVHEVKFEQCGDYLEKFKEEKLEEPVKFIHYTEDEYNPERLKKKEVKDWKELNTKYLSRGELVPLGGKINLKIKLLYPERISVRNRHSRRFEEVNFEEIMEDFIKGLASNFRRYRWGKLEITPYPITIKKRFFRTPYMNKIDDVLEEIKKQGEDHLFEVREVTPEDKERDRGLFLIVLPGARNQGLYQRLKKEILDKKKTPVQFIQALTIFKKSKKLHQLYPSILAQVYIKSTNKGLWQVACVDKKCESLYLSYDISRVQKGKRGFAGYSSVVDAMGNIVMINYLNTQKESMSEKDFRDIFHEVVRKAKRNKIFFKKIVLFKDGRVTHYEVERLKNVAKSEEFLEIVEDDEIDLYFGSVEKSFPLRIQGITKGTMLTIPHDPKRRVILFTANAPNGRFINPLELTLPLICKIRGENVEFLERDLDLTRELAHQYYKLTYLSWTNLRGMNTKFAFMQVLVQLMAKDKAEDIEAPEGYMAL